MAHNLVKCNFIMVRNRRAIWSYKSGWLRVVPLIFSKVERGSQDGLMARTLSVLDAVAAVENWLGS